jgi:hypothetical protein
MSVRATLISAQTMIAHTIDLQVSNLRCEVFEHYAVVWSISLRQMPIAAELLISDPSNRESQASSLFRLIRRDIGCPGPHIER